MSAPAAENLRERKLELSSAKGRRARKESAIGVASDFELIEGVGREIRDDSARRA